MIYSVSHPLMHSHITSTARAPTPPHSLIAPTPAAYTRFRTASACLCSRVMPCAIPVPVPCPTSGERCGQAC
ncbi:uncharacterized protein B0H18DRAFT_652996 [Fomitopsis serialis]|uniref:uncharacterized protein n=1 Tax=Fomitopsis serialis TaxID=139415 RepID=UPI002007D495|nr:uncharacterized protein B0H18DRAFT_652996 [Neoantrodia serialis]KAH9919264.1 hypothetical protein B0H18DRAFT_652996 [Neoantrodia serialis]